MKIKTGDVYREQIPRYEFASKFASGKILDITYGKFMDYAKSELFLKKAEEVWSLDLLDKDQFVSLRRINFNREIDFKIKTIKELEHEKFNLIIALNTLSISNNINELLEKIGNLITTDGIVVISVLDKTLSTIQRELIDKTNISYFAKTDLEDILKKYFEDIHFFTQENIPEIKNVDDHKFKEIKKNKTIKSSIRNLIRRILLQSDKLDIFYLKYLQPRYRAFRGYRYNTINTIKENDVIDEKYDIIPYDMKNKSMFIIAECRKPIK